MRRYRTRPYQDFIAWVGETRMAIDDAARAQAHNHNTWRFLICSVVVLMHSKFEAYFTAVVEHVVSEINAKGLAANRLPGCLWASMLDSAVPHKELQHFYVFKNERHYLEKLAKRLTDVNPLDLKWHQATHTGKIAFDVVMGGDSTYPTFERLNRVFYKIAKLDLRGQLNRRIGGDPELIIDEFGGLRCAIAHGGIPQGITIPDIVIKIQRLCRLVKAIDDMVLMEILGKAVPR